MANPNIPRAGNDATGVPLLYGIHNIAGADEPALYRIQHAAVVDDETTKSGAVSVAPLTAFGPGADVFRSLDLDETEEAVKTSAGTVFGWNITNTAGSTRYVKLYNATVASVSVGTTAPRQTLVVAAGATITMTPGSVGIYYGTAITAAATTGLADNDTGAPGANEVVCEIYFA